MIKKIKTIRKNIIRKASQIFADILVMKMKNELELEDKTKFWILYEQASKLNAYCVVFQGTYLD